MTASIIKQYQLKAKSLNTIGEFKELGREFRDKFKTSDREAINILNCKDEIDILLKYEKKNEINHKISEGISVNIDKEGDIEVVFPKSKLAIRGSLISIFEELAKRGDTREDIISLVDSSFKRSE